jgi:hypothetical protein
MSTTRLVALCVLAGSWAKLELSLSTLEMLGSSYRLLIFLMGKRISSMVMVLSLKSNTANIMQGLLADDLVVQWRWSSFGILNDVWVQVHLFAF